MLERLDDEVPDRHAHQGRAKGMVEHTLALMSDIHPEASLTMLRAMAEADLRDILPTIDVPTLVLNGDLDARAPLSVGQELDASIRGSQLGVLTGVGHLSHVGPPRPSTKSEHS